VRVYLHSKFLHSLSIDQQQTFRQQRSGQAEKRMTVGNWQAKAILILPMASEN